MKQRAVRHDTSWTGPVHFSKQTEDAPSSFEIIVYHSDKNKENVRCRYGFSINNRVV
jgi:hypothetical protein